MASFGLGAEPSVEERFRLGAHLDVELHLFTQPIEWEALYRARTLVERIARLSDRVRVRVHNFQEAHADARRGGIGEVPTIFAGRLGESRVRFVGVPSGPLLSNLLLDLLDTSRGDTLLQARTLQTLDELDHPARLRVYADSRSLVAARLARTAHQFALASSNVVAETICVDDFPGLADADAVRALPTVVINEGAGRVEGTLPEPSFVAQIQRAVSETAPFLEPLRPRPARAHSS